MKKTLLGYTTDALKITFW